MDHKQNEQKSPRSKKCRHLDVEIFELGAELLRWENGKLLPVDGAIFDSFVRHTVPMTKWVRDNIAMEGPVTRRATPERLVTAPALATVLQQLVERVKTFLTASSRSS